MIVDHRDDARRGRRTSRPWTRRSPPAMRALRCWPGDTPIRPPSTSRAGAGSSRSPAPRCVSARSPASEGGRVTRARELLDGAVSGPPTGLAQRRARRRRGLRRARRPRDGRAVRADRRAPGARSPGTSRPASACARWPPTWPSATSRSTSTGARRSLPDAERVSTRGDAARVTGVAERRIAFGSRTASPLVTVGLTATQPRPRMHGSSSLPLFDAGGVIATEFLGRVLLVQLHPLAIVGTPQPASAPAGEDHGDRDSRSNALRRIVPGVRSETERAMGDRWPSDVWSGLLQVRERLLAVVPWPAGDAHPARRRVSLAAWLVRRVVSRVARALGVDRLLERWGVAPSLRRSGILRPPSDVLGLVCFWAIFILFASVGRRRAGAARRPGRHRPARSRSCRRCSPARSSCWSAGSSPTS